MARPCAADEVFGLLDQAAPAKVQDFSTHNDVLPEAPGAMSIGLWLVPHHAGTGVRPVRLTVGNTVSIGRKKDCTIVLGELTYVSGCHCEVIVDQSGSICVHDCSANGTYINNLRIGKGRKLQAMPSDVISLAKPNRQGGATKFKIAEMSQVAAETPDARASALAASPSAPASSQSAQLPTFTATMFVAERAEALETLCDPRPPSRLDAAEASLEKQREACGRLELRWTHAVQAHADLVREVRASTARLAALEAAVPTDLVHEVRASFGRLAALEAAVPSAGPVPLEGGRGLSRRVKALEEGRARDEEALEQVTDEFGFLKRDFDRVRRQLAGSQILEPRWDELDHRVRALEGRDSLSGYPPVSYEEPRDYPAFLYDD